MTRRSFRSILLVAIVVTAALGGSVVAGAGTHAPAASGDASLVDPAANESTSRPTAVGAGTDAEPNAIGPSLRDRIGSDDVDAASRDESLEVAIHAEPDAGPAVEALVENRGGENAYRYGNVVYATLPASAVTAIADAEGVRLVTRPSTPRNTDPVTDDDVSEGVETMGADRLHEAGINGSNVTVAVIDLSFNLENPKYEDQVVDTWGDNFHTEERGAHGTSSAEVVADVAPDADLVLVTPDHSGEFHRAVDYLETSVQPDVVTMSLSWSPRTGPLDGTDPISRHIAEARANGMTWFTAAGNRGAGSGGGYSWHGEYTDPDGDDRLEFGPADERLEVSASGSGGERLFVTWDADWDSDQQRYRVHLYEPGGDVPIRTSYTTLPVEQITMPPDVQKAEVEIERVDADGTQEFVVFAWDGLVLEDHWTPGTSIEIPGTSDAPITVGAVHHDSDSIAPYSSRGPTIDGRRGIDVTAPAAVSQYERTGPYAGTSAATPHAAAAGALVLEAGGDLPPSAVRDHLTATATPLAGEPAPPNEVIGYGNVDAYAAAMRAMPVTCGTLQSGAVTLETDLSGTGDCLTVASDDVTIDGNGHTIGGDGTGSAIRIDGSGDPLTNVTITNVTIADWNRPIEVVDGTAVGTVTIRNVSVRHATGPVAIDSATDVEDSNVSVDHAGNATALAIRNSTDVTATDVTVDGNHRDGIALRDASAVAITGADVGPGRTGAGLHADGVASLTVDGGTLAGTARPGLHLERSETVAVTDVTLSGSDEFTAANGTRNVTGSAVRIGDGDPIGFRVHDAVLTRSGSTPDAPANLTAATDRIEVAALEGTATLSLPYSVRSGRSAANVTGYVHDGDAWSELETTVDADGRVTIAVDAPGVVAGYVAAVPTAEDYAIDGAYPAQSVFAAISDWRNDSIDSRVVFDVVSEWRRG